MKCVVTICSSVCTIIYFALKNSEVSANYDYIYQDYNFEENPGLPFVGFLAGENRLTSCSACPAYQTFYDEMLANYQQQKNNELDIATLGEECVQIQWSGFDFTAVEAAVKANNSVCLPGLCSYGWQLIAQADSWPRNSF